MGRCDAIDGFQIYVWRQGDVRDEISIRVELNPRNEGVWEAPHGEVARDRAQAHDLKAMRLPDARPGADPSGEERWTR